MKHVGNLRGHKVFGLSKEEYCSHPEYFNNQEVYFLVGDKRLVLGNYLVGTVVGTEVNWFKEKTVFNTTDVERKKAVAIPPAPIKVEYEGEVKANPDGLTLKIEDIDWTKIGVYSFEDCYNKVILQPVTF